MSSRRKLLQISLSSTFVIFILGTCSSLTSGYDPRTPAVQSVDSAPTVIAPLFPTPMFTPPLSPVLPLQPTPAAIFAGSAVDSGPFTFYLFLYKDASLSKDPAAPSLYSDLNGIGAYMFWRCNGPGLAGPAEEYWGTQPRLDLLNSYSEIQTNQTGGRSGGILLPGGFFIPGTSKAGDRIDIVLQLKTVKGNYSASISFTLRDMPFGFEPVDISTTALDDFSMDPSLRSGVTAWAEKWSSLTPIAVAASSFALPIDHQTYHDIRGFAIDYPGEWCIHDQHDLVQLVSTVAVDPSQGCMTNYEVELEITLALRPPRWKLVDELGSLQQPGTSTLVEMHNLLLTGGIPAARLVLNGETGESRVLLAIINSWSIRIYGHGDAKWFDGISDTLRASP